MGICIWSIANDLYTVLPTVSEHVHEHTAHALGFKHGGLITLETQLSALKKKVLSLRANVNKHQHHRRHSMESEEQVVLLTKALMEYEVLYITPSNLL
jgi:hypothetical protein